MKLLAAFHVKSFMRIGQKFIKHRNRMHTKNHPRTEGLDLSVDISTVYYQNNTFELLVFLPFHYNAYRP